MKSKVRFAVIGCGRIASKHLEAIRAAPDAELAAVCDLNEERSRLYSAPYGVPAYKNYHVLLRNESVDAVTLLTPSGMHPLHAVDIIQRYRKPVILEKPMVLNQRDLGRLKSAADQQGVKIFPVYQNRYNKAVQVVRKSIVDGNMGKLVLGSVNLCWCRPQRYYDQAPWRGTWSHDGGALTNQGIHFVDLLLYLLGDIESVFAYKATQLVNVEIEDTLVASVRFKNGALGTIEITTAARPDDREAVVSVLAEKGNALIGGIAANILHKWSLNPDICKDNSENFPDAYGFGHKPFYVDVVNDLIRGIPHPISFDEGSRAVRLLNTIYASCEEGRPVRYDENASSSLFGRKNEKIDALYLSDPEEAAS